MWMSGDSSGQSSSKFAGVVVALVFDRARR